MRNSLLKPFFNLAILISLTLSAAHVGAAPYQGENPYLVKNVFINADGKTPTKARNNALVQARREAFSILLGRLSIYDGFDDNISEEEIADMVHSQQIINERIAGNSYSAIFTISFSKDFVDSVLASKSISKDSQITEKYLVFPIKRSGNKNLLWEDINDWRSAWERVLGNDQSEIKLPVGDIDDISLINANTAKNANFNYFADILNKYEADVAIIAYFDLDKIDNKINIELRKIRKFRQQKVKLGFVNIDRLSPIMLLSKVAKRTADHISDIKKELPQNKDKLDENSLINIDILISNLQDWIMIKQNIENMGFIKELKTISISKDLVKIIVKYDENNGDIIDLFADHNLILGKKEEKQYFLFLDW
ncbi:MAG: DUF2066 domain-containing protein [Proteobacteria bacterium]|nr:DUF2066 domain-containing protein [Pseudomonadota bacterium]